MVRVARCFERSTQHKKPNEVTREQQGFFHVTTSCSVRHAKKKFQLMLVQVHQVTRKSPLLKQPVKMIYGARIFALFIALIAVAHAFQVSSFSLFFFKFFNFCCFCFVRHFLCFSGLCQGHSFSSENGFGRLQRRACQDCIAYCCARSDQGAKIIVHMTQCRLSGKGILAVDESTKTIGKRLQSIGIENTEEARQAYRGTCSTLVANFNIVGLFQLFSVQACSSLPLDSVNSYLVQSSMRKLFIKAMPMEHLLLISSKPTAFSLESRLTLAFNLSLERTPLRHGLGYLPKSIDFISPLFARCTGLDGLKERAAAYYAQGARFCKWRAVLQITSDGCPTPLSIQENAWGLARYARACQESGDDLDFFFNRLTSNVFFYV